MLKDSATTNTCLCQIYIAGLRLDPGMDIHHKNGYSSDLESKSGSKPEFVSMQWEVCLQYDVAIGFGVRIRVRVWQCK